MLLKGLFRMGKEGINLEALNPIYKQLYDLVGEEHMLSIYADLRGIQVTFPAHLYDGRAVKKMIIKSDEPTAVLAKKFGYSQKWVRSVIKKYK